ncbi:MAG: cupin domain-containing protein [Dehalococcoidia bacterium]
MKNHVKYFCVTPFSFYDLTIRELSPTGYERLSVAEVRVPPGAAHPKARSIKSDKLYVCIEGTITFQLNGESLQLNPLDVLLIPRAEWFSYRNDVSEEGKLLLVHTPPFDMAREEIVS